MKKVIKVTKARNKKYNNQVFTLENCIIVGDYIMFDSLKFNNKIYQGIINPIRNNMTISFGRQSTIQFDEIQILN